jgi:hypothetical protein
VNSASYCEVLLKLQDAIRRKLPGHLARGALFIMTMSDPIQPEKPRDEFKDYSGNLLNIRLTGWTWSLVISICFVLSKTTLVANISLMTKRLKWRCGRG